MAGLAQPGSPMPAGPELLSMYDPVHIGIDEFSAPVRIKVIYKNLLAAGEPGRTGTVIACGECSETWSTCDA